MPLYARGERLSMKLEVTFCDQSEATCLLTAEQTGLPD